MNGIRMEPEVRNARDQEQTSDSPLKRIRKRNMHQNEKNNFTGQTLKTALHQEMSFPKVSIVCDPATCKKVGREAQYF